MWCGARRMTWLGRLYVWATHRLYDELAWAYDMVSWLVSLGRWSGWRMSALDHLAGRRVLELGFGTGELLVGMAKRGLEPVGLDASIAMHRIAGQKLARQSLDVPRVRGVAEALPFRDGCFDSIVCTFPAQYIVHPATLNEANRVLRHPNPATGEGGGCLVVVGLRITVDLRLWQRAMRFLFGGGGEEILACFTRVARAAGLEVSVLEQVEGRVRVPVIVAEHACR